MADATPSPQFIERSALRTAREYANREVHGDARPDQVRWLHEHPTLWLRALYRIKRDTTTHIGQDRAKLTPLKPRPGQDPSPEYMELKAAVTERSSGRLNFMRRVEERMDEVAALIDPRPVPGYWSIGQLISHFLEIAELADAGDLAAAADKALHQAKYLTQLRKDESA